MTPQEVIKECRRLHYPLWADLIESLTTQLAAQAEALWQMREALTEATTRLEKLYDEWLQHESWNSAAMGQAAAECIEISLGIDKALALTPTEAEKQVEEWREKAEKWDKAQGYTEELRKAITAKIGESDDFELFSFSMAAILHKCFTATEPENGWITCMDHPEVGKLTIEVTRQDGESIFKRAKVAEDQADTLRRQLQEAEALVGRLRKPMKEIVVRMREACRLHPCGLTDFDEHCFANPCFCTWSKAETAKEAGDVD